MAQAISHRKIASFAADKLVACENVNELLREIAAYLIETKQVRAAGLLVAAIEDELQARGVVVADITSAYPLSAQLRAEIQRLIGAKELHTREHIDQSVIAGVKIELPDSQFDDTVRHKLIALKGAK